MRSSHDRIVHDQTKTESRDGASLCGGYSSRPTPAREQGRAHVRFAGDGFSCVARRLTASKTGGGFGPRTFSSSRFARRCPLSGLSNRRVVGFLPRQPATHSALSLARAFNFTQHTDGQVSDAAHSLEHLSYVGRSMPNHRTKGVVNVRELVGEIRNV